MKVAVLAGGLSSEHSVSLESARSVLDGLEAGGHECLAIVIDREGVWRTEDPRSSRDGAGAGEPIALQPGPWDRRRGCRVPGPARPVWRGRNGSGDARVRRRALCGSGRAGIRPLHGQGCVQAADGAGGLAAGALRGCAGARMVRRPRRGDRARPRAAAATVREAGAARLELRNLEGLERGRASGGARGAPSTTTRRS